uniref:Uncharacterized protein LOC116937122 n=1 Tax=Petromyzon marinus TaxID=7757 RepID=A0AAJ7SJ84_PETMA|nr:uncharacterized protein LOC116937122 [Petromyzon marinus]
MAIFTAVLTVVLLLTQPMVELLGGSRRGGSDINASNTTTTTINYSGLVKNVSASAGVATWGPMFSSHSEDIVDSVLPALLHAVGQLYSGCKEAISSTMLLNTLHIAVHLWRFIRRQVSEQHPSSSPPSAMVNPLVGRDLHEPSPPPTMPLCSNPPSTCTWSDFIASSPHWAPSRMTPSQPVGITRPLHTSTDPPQLHSRCLQQPGWALEQYPGQCRIKLVRVL